MKNHHLLSIIFVLAMLVSIALRSENASANLQHAISRGSVYLVSSQQAASTAVPTDSQSGTASVTPESRLLPPIGSNAGLVIGASVLVLIIIGGVLGSRRRQNH